MVRFNKANKMHSSFCSVLFCSVPFYSGFAWFPSHSFGFAVTKLLGPTETKRYVSHCIEQKHDLISAFIFRTGYKKKHKRKTKSDACHTIVWIIYSQVWFIPNETENGKRQTANGTPFQSMTIDKEYFFIFKR